MAQKESRILKVLSEHSKNKFINGRVSSADLKELKEQMNRGTKGIPVAMFITNIPFFLEMCVPAGCAEIHQTFLNPDGGYRLIMFQKTDDFSSIIASCPYQREGDNTRVGDDDDGEDGKQYASAIYVFSEVSLQSISAFSDGYINISCIPDGFRLSQGPEDFTTKRAQNQQQRRITSLTITCTIDPPATEVLADFERVLDAVHNKLTMPYRFSSNGMKSTTAPVTRYKYIRFTCDGDWLGDGVLEGDTTNEGARPTWMQFIPITDAMFNDGNVDMSDGNPAKRPKKRKPTDEDEDDFAAELAALENGSLGLDDESNEIGALLNQCAKAISREEKSEPRPSMMPKTDWLPELWKLVQGDSESAKFIFGGKTILATCTSEFGLADAVVKLTEKLCNPSKIACGFFTPLTKGCSTLLVMSHSSSASSSRGVTSVTSVNPVLFLDV